MINIFKMFTIGPCYSFGCPAVFTIASCGVLWCSVVFCGVQAYPFILTSFLCHE